MPETKNKQEDILKALLKYEEAFDSMFSQCFSNGMTNAWGEQVDCTLLNEAHYLAGKALKGVNYEQ